MCQQVLCPKHGFKSLQDVMILITKLVNLISAHGLNKRNILGLFNEVNSAYNCDNVRWLSRRQVL